MKTIITILIILVSQIIYSQEIIYQYDNTGNQTSREPFYGHSLGSEDDTDPRGENLPMEELLALVDRTANTTAITNNTSANNTKLNQNDKDVSSTTLFNNITVYPNPATDIVYLNKEGFGIQKEAVATVYLINSQGKILERIKTADTRTAIDVRHLAGGVYYVRYVGDEVSLAWRVVKL